VQAMDDEVRRDAGSPSNGSLALSLSGEVPARATAHGVDGDAPSAEPRRSLDPGSIGRLVEQEVANMLDAAEAEADRIGSKAMVVVQAAEEKIEALQRELASAVAQLRALAERTEQSAPTTQRSLAGSAPTTQRSLAGSVPTTQRSLAGSVPTTQRSPSDGIPAVLTEPPAAMRAVANDDPPALDIPASEEVVRLLRQHLT